MYSALLLAAVAQAAVVAAAVAGGRNSSSLELSAWRAVPSLWEHRVAQSPPGVPPERAGSELGPCLGPAYEACLWCLRLWAF